MNASGFNQARSPHTGDRVRAQADARDGAWVEGILHLRIVPSLGYVQVNVLTRQAAIAVKPSTVEVLAPNAESAERLDGQDPLRHDPGWQPIHDLNQAEAAGLLPDPRPGTDRSWATLLADALRLVDPLLVAGWKVTDTDRHSDAEFGDSVFVDLERDGVQIELEYYDIGGDLAAWPLDEQDDPDEPATATFWIIEPTLDDCIHAYRSEGWLP